MSRVLVVYYSRTGNTKRVAMKIAGACDASSEEIQDSTRRTGFFGFMRSAWQAMRRTIVQIGKPEFDPADFDLVVVGTPVWASNMASPVRSYLEQNRHKFYRVAAFCTQGGSGGEKVLQNISELCDKPLAGSLIINDDDNTEQKMSQLVAPFVAQLVKPHAEPVAVSV